MGEHPIRTTDWFQKFRNCTNATRQNEARKRTRLEATLEKLEQLEASLDGEAAKGSGKHTASQNSKSEEDGKISTETRSVGEAENLVNGRNPKRSKLSSRK